MRTPGEIWGGKFAALGAVLVGIALIGGIVLLVTGDDDSDDSAPVASGSAAAGLKPVQERSLGIAASIPADWSSAKRRGAINLESEDRCVAVALSAPVPSETAGELRDATIEALRGDFGKVDVRRSQGDRVSGLPTSGALIGVRNKRGDPVVIQLSVSRGRKLAYLTQVVFRQPPCEESADELRAVLASLRFSR